MGSTKANKKSRSMSRRGIGEEILNLRKKEMSYREIQEILDCSKGTIEYHCKKAGLNGAIKYPTELTDTQKKEILEYSKTNTNVNDAIKELGYARKTLLKYGKFITN